MVSLHKFQMAKHHKKVATGGGSRAALVLGFLAGIILGYSVGTSILKNLYMFYRNQSSRKV